MKLTKWMHAFRRRRPRAEVLGDLARQDPTKDYRPPRNVAYELAVEKLPLFTIFKARMMLRDPVVQIGLEVRNAILSAAEIKVKTGDERVAKYLADEFQTIWTTLGTRVRRTKAYGYQALQWEFDKQQDGLTHVCGCKEFSPHDVRALTASNRLVGMSVHGGQMATSVRMYAPRATWLVYDDEFGTFYGYPVLKRSYSPWFEKWMLNGGVKTRQLRMVKDAYMGDVIQFPYGQTIRDHNGNDVPWKEVLREVSENRLSGATLMLPMLYDANGQKLIEYTQPVDTGRPDGIYQWVDNLDRDIWRGMSVFEEVIHAAEVGSGYSGRSVPLALCIQSCQSEFNDYLRQLDQHLWRQMVWYNFGRDIDYQVLAKPLLETFSDQLGESSMGGKAMGGQPGQQQPPPAPSQQPQKIPQQFAEDSLPDAIPLAHADAIAKLALDQLKADGRSAWKRLRKATRRLGWGVAALKAILDATAETGEALKQSWLEVTEDAFSAAAMVGVAEVQRRFDLAVAPAEGSAAPPPKAATPPKAAPPPPSVPLEEGGRGREPRVRFPVEESARKTLRDSNVFTGANWRQTAEAVHRGAFAVTSDMADDVTEALRDAIHEALATGQTRQEFLDTARGIMTGEEGALSDSRIELIFRANTASYLSNAADQSLKQPLVADAFPYRRYEATRDDRVREEHEALEAAGLQGSAVYRGDDPVWFQFRPPWCWNCRCSWAPVSVRQAARAGVEEAQEWLDRARDLSEQFGGPPAQHMRTAAPANPAWVAWPTLHGLEITPCEGWERDPSGAQLGERQKSLFGGWVEEDHPRQPKGRKEGGQFVEKEKQGMLWTGLDLLPGQRDFLDEGGDAITESTKARQSGGERKGAKYDDGPQFAKAKILEVLAKADSPMSLAELAREAGIKAGDQMDPLTSPLNRALVALRDSGDIQVHESKSGFGEPRFSRPDFESRGATQKNRSLADIEGEMDAIVEAATGRMGNATWYNPSAYDWMESDERERFHALQQEFSAHPEYQEKYSREAARERVKEKRAKRRASPRVYDTFADGEWITIGGHPNEEKGVKHEDGTPVKVSDEGRIIAGPDDIEGMYLDPSKKPKQKKVDGDEQAEEWRRKQREKDDKLREWLNSPESRKQPFYKMTSQEFAAKGLQTEAERLMEEMEAIGRWHKEPKNRYGFDDEATIRRMEQEDPEAYRVYEEHGKSYSWRQTPQLEDAFDRARANYQSMTTAIERGWWGYRDNVREEWERQVKRAVKTGKELPMEVLKEVWHEDWLPKKYRDQWNLHELKRTVTKGREQLRYAAQEVGKKLDRAKKGDVGQRIERAKKIADKVTSEIGEAAAKADVAEQELAAAGRELAHVQSKNDYEGKDKDLEQLKEDYLAKSAAKKQAALDHLAILRESKQRIWDALAPESPGVLKWNTDGDEHGRMASPDGKEAMTFLHRIAGRAIEDLEITVEATKKEHYGGNRAYCSGQTISLTKWSNASTIVHEIGHAIDHGSDIGKASKAFMVRRSINRGTEADHLGSGYESDEVAFKGAFAVGDYTSKWYHSEDSSEVLSMGLQHLFQNPAAFLKDDPEHAAYVVAVLHGTFGGAKRSEK